MYKLPLLSTPTISETGVNTCAGGSATGVMTAGAVGTGSTGGASLGLIKNAHTSPIAAMTANSKNTRINKSLRWLRVRTFSRFKLLFSAK